MRYFLLLVFFIFLKVSFAQKSFTFNYTIKQTFSEVTHFNGIDSLSYYEIGRPKYKYGKIEYKNSQVFFYSKKGKLKSKHYVKVLKDNENIMVLGSYNIKMKSIIFNKKKETVEMVDYILKTSKLFKN